MGPGPEEWVKLSSSWCRTQAEGVLVVIRKGGCRLLTGLMELLARVARQAASAMGFKPASASAAAQETTVGARAAMHSVVVVSDVED